MRNFLAGLLVGLSVFIGPALSAISPTSDWADKPVTVTEKTTVAGPVKPRIRLAQQGGVRVSRSMALRLAMAASPGSQGLGVRYVPRRRGYMVKLKTGNRIHRVFVDAYSGAVRR